MDIYKSFYGYCPFHEAELEIEIIYSSVNAIGMDKNYKINGMEPCEDFDDCPHLDRWGRCPIYAKAPVALIE